MENNLIQLIEQFGHSGVFGHLTTPERIKLAGMAVRKILKKGDTICYQEDESRFVLLVESGALHSVISSPDGRDHIASTWAIGEEFWSPTLFDGYPIPSTLRAIQKGTVVHMWFGDSVLDLVLDNRAATMALIRRQTHMLRKRRDSIYNLAFNPVASRLAKLILSKFDTGDGSTVQRDLTLEDMASMIATSPEVICRIMYQFQNEGYLKVNRTTITLDDHDALERLILKDN